MANTLPEGVLTPLNTVFLDNGEVDIPMLKKLTKFTIDAGGHGLFVLGSAGQGPAMTTAQRKAALEAIMDVAQKKVPVIAHVGTPDSFTGRELARHARENGVNSIAIVPPYYYSDHTEYEVQRHYAEIAEGAPDLPIVIYDNPKYTGIPMNPPVVARLHKELPAVAGIKPSFSGLEQMYGYMNLLPHMKVYSSGVEYVATGVPFGIKGVINPPLTIFPEICVELWNAAVEKKYEAAIDLQKRANKLRVVVTKYTNRYGRAAFTAVARMRGFDIVRYPRWTSHTFTQEQLAELRKELVDAGAGKYLV
jgi:dihydrodipicolinate synthase/N-acetylneuraminate lyase